MTEYSACPVAFSFSPRVAGLGSLTSYSDAIAHVVGKGKGEESLSPCSMCSFCRLGSVGILVLSKNRFPNLGPQARYSPWQASMKNPWEALCDCPITRGYSAWPTGSGKLDRIGQFSCYFLAQSRHIKSLFYLRKVSCLWICYTVLGTSPCHRSHCGC